MGVAVVLAWPWRGWRTLRFEVRRGAPSAPFWRFGTRQLRAVSAHLSYTPPLGGVGSAPKVRLMLAGFKVRKMRCAELGQFEGVKVDGEGKQ